jgi:DNA-binding response OmpR family regulator
MQKIFVVIDPVEADGAQTIRNLTVAVPGSQALYAASAEAALELLEERRLAPSIIFSAFELPGMSGLELLGEMRERRWLDRVPVAIISEPVSDRQVVASYRLGACAFLTRPVRPLELREAVRDFGIPATTLQAGAIVDASRPARVMSAA